MRTAVLAFVLLTAAVPASDEAALERGRELTRLLHAGDSATLSGRFSPEFLEKVGGAPGLSKLVDKLREEAGRELSVSDERTYAEAGTVSYYRLSRYEKIPDVTARWVLKPGGTVLGVSIHPSVTPAPTDKLDYRTRANLRLPFGRVVGGGEWQVAWGGRDPISNYHVVAPDQRFAYDFVVARDGAVWRGEGARNEDHFCWGQPLVAPAAGRVVTAVGEHPDNPRPGATTEGVPPPGNHVVIEHGEGEHSLIAHLAQGSLAVRAGQQVAAGQRLGTCGNSGRSTLPHLHYHLQTGSAFGEGVGLPAQFNDYVISGKPVARGEPQRGERILPQR